MKRAVLQTKEKGASGWLTFIPIQEYGFAPTKSELRDALRIRYDKQLQGMSSKCPCGEKYDLSYAVNCKRGGFVVMRHSNVRDFEANLLKTIQNDVEIEPVLQKIDNVRIDGRTGDEARPDIRARVVWRQGQNAFFDILLTNVNNNSQKNQTVETILKKHEKEKKRAYKSRIMKEEHGTFTPLVFSLTGGEGPGAFMFYKHIAQKIAAKTEENYDGVLSLIRCKLSFMILKSVLICVRGSRSVSNDHVHLDDVSLTGHAAGLF